MTIQVLDVAVPVNFTPRSYQLPFIQAMLTGEKKRAILVWHRRAGKDKTTLNLMILKMLQRVGVYYYFTPTYTQGKKFLWDGIGRDGFKFMHHFPGFDDPSQPGSLVKQKWEDELKVELKQGSIFQIVGTDRLDGVRGTNPVGCVFSEYPMMNPQAWDIVRPILRENDGWAVFVYTPMGKNHGFRLWQHVLASARISKQWYTSHLTIDDTRRDAPGEARYGERVVTRQDVEDDIAEGMSEALAQQEYYCSWEGYLEGSYYGDLITRMRADGRIGKFPHAIDALVDTAWDLGLDDSTAIVFTQTLRGVPRIIDYFESDGKGMDWYIKKLHREYTSYDYGLHFGPHDIKVREYTTGNTRLEAAANLGLNFEVVPKLMVEDGIDATRRFLAKATADDNPRVEKLFDILNSYRREKDQETQTWSKQPVHDWTSHGADATRYRAVAFFDPELGRRVTSFARMRFNVLQMGDPSEQTEAIMGGRKERWPSDGRWRSGGSPQDEAEM